MLFLEPFYGGSHKAFADGLAENSSHRIDVFSMPARFWKWRMRGAALHYFRIVENPEAYDVVFCSDMMSLADLKGLWGSRMPPSILYFHESQLSYPVPEGEKLDYHFAFTNLTSALSADRVVFNSQTHSNAFFESLERFLRKLPEYSPGWAIGAIRKKCSVIHPGCDLSDRTSYAEGKDSVPLILWNHRWEFDKDPKSFFDAVYAVDAKGLSFNLAILGENFQAVPKPFLEAREKLSHRILQYGYVESRAEYLEWLARSRIVVSTALQENFGISVVEAMNAGCFPVLPRRLSYPEIVPPQYHTRSLYGTGTDFLKLLIQAIDSPEPPDTSDLIAYTSRFSWASLVETYDSLIAETAG